MVPSNSMMEKRSEVQVPTSDSYWRSALCHPHLVFVMALCTQTDAHTVILLVFETDPVLASDWSVRHSSCAQIHNIVAPMTLNACSPFHFTLPNFFYWIVTISSSQKVPFNNVLLKIAISSNTLAIIKYSHDWRNCKYSAALYSQYTMASHTFLVILRSTKVDLEVLTFVKSTSVFVYRC